MLCMSALIVSSESIHLGFLERRCSPNNALSLDIAVSAIHLAADLLEEGPPSVPALLLGLIIGSHRPSPSSSSWERNRSMAIGLEAKGYKESETRVENVTGIAKR
jgi:hypothetical protein